MSTSPQDPQPKRLGLPFATGTGILVSVVLLYLLVSTARNYLKLRQFKGPWLASISPVWMFYYTCRGELYLAVEAALHKYGL